MKIEVKQSARYEIRVTDVSKRGKVTLEIYQVSTGERARHSLIVGDVLDFNISTSYEADGVNTVAIR